MQLKAKASPAHPLPKQPPAQRHPQEQLIQSPEFNQEWQSELSKEATLDMTVG
jgi:hypothetical protein